MALCSRCHALLFHFVWFQMCQAAPHIKIKWFLCHSSLNVGLKISGAKDVK